jgi:hypothetical protein
MLLRVALLRNEVSEERSLSILRMTRIGERFDVFTAVTIKNAVFCDVTPCGSCKKRGFGGMQSLHPQDDKNRRKIWRFHGGDS